MSGLPFELGHADRGDLELGLFRYRVPRGEGQLVGRGRLVAWFTAAGVPVAVVERDEHHACSAVADPRRAMDCATCRLDTDPVSFGDPEPLGISCRDLDPYRRRRIIEPLRTTRLRTGVEVIHRAAGGANQRISLTGRLGWFAERGRLEERPAVRTGCLELLRRRAPSSQQIVAVVLAVGRLSRELGVGVEAVGAVRVFVGARPGDAAATAQPLVGQPGVVAGPTAAAVLPRLERLLRRGPADQRLPVPITEVHPPGIV